MHATASASTAVQALARYKSHAKVGKKLSTIQLRKQIKILARSVNTTVVMFCYSVVLVV